ncbi:MAG: sulfur reduction protein DsrE [Methanosarcinales archaeon]|nr:sulfur reduction protein DsrE [Methanosarcinales archaeon]
MKTVTIVLTDGPYISEYAEMAYRIAHACLGQARVNLFLYLDAVHIPKVGQTPDSFANAGRLFLELAEEGVTIRACQRCSNARGYQGDEEGSCRDILPGIRIASLYQLQKMIESSDRVVSLSR